MQLIARLRRLGHKLRREVGREVATNQLQPFLDIEACTERIMADVCNS